MPGSEHTRDARAARSAGYHPSMVPRTKGLVGVGLLLAGVGLYVALRPGAGHDDVEAATPAAGSAGSPSGPSAPAAAGVARASAAPALAAAGSGGSGAGGSGVGS